MPDPDLPSCLQVLCRVPRADWGVGGHKLVCLQLKQLAGRS